MFNYGSKRKLTFTVKHSLYSYAAKCLRLQQSVICQIAMQSSLWEQSCRKDDAIAVACETSLQRCGCHNGFSCYGILDDGMLLLSAASLVKYDSPPTGSYLSTTRLWSMVRAHRITIDCLKRISNDRHFAYGKCLNCILLWWLAVHSRRKFAKTLHRKRARLSAHRSGFQGRWSTLYVLLCATFHISVLFFLFMHSIFAQY